MPAQQTTSSFAAKMGSRINAAIAAHANDETNFGFERLPPGINNGIAQLTKCYFEEFKPGTKHAGKFYWRAEGTVISPEYVHYNNQDVKVVGKTTSIMFNCFETTNQEGKVTTEADNVADILNEMRKLGADTSGCTSAADLEAIAEALADAKPYFKFSTSVRAARKPTDTPGVWENWHGSKDTEEFVAKLQAANGALSGTKDSSPVTQTLTSANGTAAHAKPTTPAGKAATTPKPTAATKPASQTVQQQPSLPLPQGKVGEEGVEDLDALSKLANGNNKGAQQKLVDIALSAGIEQEIIDSAESWEDVVTLINESNADDQGQAEEGTEEGEEGEFAPNLGEVYGFRPLNPKTKEQSQDKKEVEVVGVNPGNHTVDLRATDNKKLVYKGIPWDSLESAD